MEFSEIILSLELEVGRVGEVDWVDGRKADMMESDVWVGGLVE